MDRFMKSTVAAKWIHAYVIYDIPSYYMVQCTYTIYKYIYMVQYTYTIYQYMYMVEYTSIWHTAPSYCFTSMNDSKNSTLSLMIPRDLSGRGAARAEDAQGTPDQSHISPSILVYEDKQHQHFTLNPDL